VAGPAAEPGLELAKDGRGPAEAPSGRDGPDFTLTLDEAGYDGPQTNDDFMKLDLDHE
jgi:hypothetical protein